MKHSDIKKKALALHKKLGGKIETIPVRPLKTSQDLSLMYTPGVGAVSSHIAARPSRARDLTIQRNTVAVISDGSAVLGLGNVGPEAALPVLEGKAAIFKTFAHVDAFPIALDTQDTDEIIETVKRLAPSFGGINLEDISAPRCFDIEARLTRELSIPVMHDDQHGTAIVVLAGLLNAARVTKRALKQARVVVVGAGAAGTAIAMLLARFGVRDIIVIDSKGIISKHRTGLNAYKQKLAGFNRRNVSGALEQAARDADVLIGVSGPKTISGKHVRLMRENPIVFALANPTPEIFPEEARAAGARVVATGRSDYPNQVNNALVFPGVFRGALDRKVRAITDTMKLRAADALARVVKKPTIHKIIPGLFEKRVVKAVSGAIR